MVSGPFDTRYDQGMAAGEQMAEFGVPGCFQCYRCGVFRRFIGRADTLWDYLVRATVIPYLGTFVFLSLWTALLWTRSLLYGGLANLHDTLSLYLMGMIAVTVSFFVVIPYGLLCQYVMNSVAHSRAA